LVEASVPAKLRGELQLWMFYPSEGLPQAVDPRRMNVLAVLSKRDFPHTIDLVTDR
jgi:hypothetical protein